MKTPDTPSAKSALSLPQPINADIADNAGELSVKVEEARAAALTLTDKTCEVFMALCSSGDKAKSYRAMRHYFRAVDLYLAIERNLEELP
jgi:ethanolamine utilization cobalamin adenosyltransferase